MLIVALTGGLGAGKSTAARYFASQGARVIDLDAVAAQVLRESAVVASELRKAFGAGVVADDGSLDRARLAEVAFSTAENTATLNAIVHPAVIAALECELDALRRDVQPPDVVVVEVPLLAEAPEVARAADRVLALEAPMEVRLARSMGRGMTESDARARITRQADDAARASLAHDVIQNDGTEADLECALAAYWELLRTIGGQ